ncbi:MAG: sulfite exporter TauE/SafE family protein [Balneolaceae bacterium]
MEIWTALIIGFAGSFHCIGMCGPIALALPGQGESLPGLILSRLLYNLGRILTYGLLGAVFGIIGHSMALAGFQQTFSVLLGIAVIAAVFLKSRFPAVNRSNYFLSRLKNLISFQFKKSGLRTLFTIGFLNGLLPCGFVYVGLAGSLTTGSILSGSLYMMLFGLGTLPAMLAMSLAPGLISLNARRRINRFIPAAAVLFGLFLIFRALMMGTGH